MKKVEDFCPVRDILSKTADKWSLLVMHELQESSVMRFSELQRSIPDISQKMLTQTLRKLEQMQLLAQDGICSRQYGPEQRLGCPYFPR